MKSPGKTQIKKIVNIAGNALAVISLAFVSYQVVQKAEQIKDYFSVRLLPVGFFAVLLCSFTIFINSKVFTYILSLFTDRTPDFSAAAPIYIKTNLYKYLPGNVMHYIGRDQLTVITGINHSDILMASLIEICFSAFSALCTGMVLSGKHIIAYIADTFEKKTIGIAAAGIVFVFISIVILLYYKRSLFKQFISEHFTKNKTINLCRALLMNLLCSFINGFVFTVLLFSFLYPNIPISLFPTIAGISIIAWLIGFITPGSPGGLGVRELMLSILLSGIPGADAIPACAIFYRIVTTAGDIIAFLVSLLFYRHASVDTPQE